MVADELLVQAVAAGDGEALATLCRRWERPLLRFVGRYTGGRDVEDLYQETWLGVVRGAPRFDPERRFSTWLFQIALNHCRDWHRRRRPDQALDTVPEPAAEGLGSAETTEAQLDVERLLAALPPAQREVVLLRYVRDLGEREMAEILGCPPGTVKSRLHHALARLVELAHDAVPAPTARSRA
jgi:RNA polymerase sigma-70 factor, ECF subfamily